jgi:hypothetical protein
MLDFLFGVLRKDDCLLGGGCTITNYMRARVTSNMNINTTNVG